MNWRSPLLIPLLSPYHLGHGAKQINHLLGANRGSGETSAHSVLVAPSSFRVSFACCLGGGSSRDLPFERLCLWDTAPWLRRKSCNPSLPVSRFKTGQDLRDS